SAVRVGNACPRASTRAFPRRDDGCICRAPPPRSSAPRLATQARALLPPPAKPPTPPAAASSILWWPSGRLPPRSSAPADPNRRVVSPASAGLTDSVTPTSAPQYRLALSELPSVYFQWISCPVPDLSDDPTASFVSSESWSGGWFLRSCPWTIVDAPEDEKTHAAAPSFLITTPSTWPLVSNGKLLSCDLPSGMYILLTTDRVADPLVVHTTHLPPSANRSSVGDAPESVLFLPDFLTQAIAAPFLLSTPAG